MSAFRCPLPNHFFIQLQASVMITLFRHSESCASSYVMSTSAEEVALMRQIVDTLQEIRRTDTVCAAGLRLVKFVLSMYFASVPFSGDERKHLEQVLQLLRKVKINGISSVHITAPDGTKYTLV